MLATATPERQQTLAHGHRVVRYHDSGGASAHPVVFFGGIGTSAGAIALAELAARGRPHRLRFISVERNGFGETPFTPGLAVRDAVDDALAVLTALGVGRFSVVAISGGGPYAARLLERVPDRARSVHLAAATSGGALLARGAAANLLGEVEAIVQDPEAFWEYPASSPVHEIPGFMAAARSEGRHALGNAGHAAAALRHELALLCADELPDLSAVSAPVFLYWGAADPLVGLEDARAWQRTFAAAEVTTRVYEDAGHDVQYMHWGEILGDLEGVPT